MIKVLEDGQDITVGIGLAELVSHLPEGCRARDHYEDQVRYDSDLKARARRNAIAACAQALFAKGTHAPAFCWEQAAKFVDAKPEDL